MNYEFCEGFGTSMVILWQGRKERFTSLSFRRANAIARPLRKLVMPSDEVGYYHVYNRCVRGGFLLAAPAASGQSDPRKDWIQSHIQYLCQGFAVEVCDFCLMDSHLLCGAPHNRCYVKLGIMWT
jgi:hypothetical protein